MQTNSEEIFGSNCRIVHGDVYSVVHSFLTTGVISYICKNDILSKFENIKEFSKEEKGILRKSRRTLDTLNIELSGGCNFRCEHCYIEAEKTQKFLGYNSYLKIIQRLQEYGKPVDIRLSGGEPSLNPQFSDICKTTLNVHPISHHTIITNGTIKFNDFISLLKLGFHFQISIYGFSEETYKRFSSAPKNAFLKVIKNLLDCPDEYRKQILLIYFNSNITNLDYKKFVDFSNSNHFRYKYSGINYIGRAIGKDSVTFNEYGYDDTYKEINLIKSDLCEKDRMNIDINGEITPCPYFSGRFSSLGNIFQESFEDILESAELREFDSLDIDSIPQCANCPVRYICSGGCLAETSSVYGSYYHKYPQCHFDIDSKAIKENCLYKIFMKSPGNFKFVEIK